MTVFASLCLFVCGFCVCEFLHMHLLYLCTLNKWVSAYTLCMCICVRAYLCMHVQYLHRGQTRDFKDLATSHSAPSLSYWPLGYRMTERHMLCTIQMKSKKQRHHTHKLTHTEQSLSTISSLNCEIQIQPSTNKHQIFFNKTSEYLFCNT